MYILQLLFAFRFCFYFEKKIRKDRSKKTFAWLVLVFLSGF